MVSVGVVLLEKKCGEDGVRVVGEAWRVGRYYSEECLMCHGKGCMSDN